MFYKVNNIFVVIVAVGVCCFFQQRAIAIISSQQCDKELDQYCPLDKYNNTKLRLRCIETKKNFFTYECVVRILGLPVNNNENLDQEKTPWLISQEEEQKLIETGTDLLAHQQNAEIKDEFFDVVTDNESITDPREIENFTLKDTTLRTNCLGDMSRLCKMKTRKGVVILKEPLEFCINKMIRRESRLTLSCHVSLLNILNKSNKQYTHYNINGITIHKSGRLKNIKKAKESRKKTK